MDIFNEVLLAQERIRPYLRETYLEYSPYYSQLATAHVYLKLENLQVTGSFKARGAMNKLLSLSEEERARGIVTASTGNHGAAVAYSSSKVQTKALIFVPENALPTKLEAIKRLGAEVRHHGLDSAATEMHARAYAAQHGLSYISPYNDPQVVGGQGTIGLELSRQLQDVDAVFVSVGGGGLISGIGAYLKSFRPQVQIIGCSPFNSQVMIQSIAAGAIVDRPSLPTLSDGTAGGVEKGAITFELCQRYVDEYVTVTETEIKKALKQFLHTHHMLIEGSAAVAIAAYEQIQARFKGQKVVIVLCGANIGLAQLQSVLAD